MDIYIRKYKELVEFDHHKKIVRLSDPKTGLKGFIAIHNLCLGPAVGGTRMFPYRSEEEALKDVLRLSRAMSFKCALAGVHFGGGKGVIIGDPLHEKSEELLRSYAKKVSLLKGTFFTGEDVGISEEDVQYMLTVSPYFIGKRNLAGDPSPYAALSTFYSIQTSVGLVLKKDSLKGLSVAVKGTGKVGGELVRLLIEAGAQVVISDIRKEIAERMKKKYSRIQIVDPKKIHILDVTVYSPCALGNEFTSKTMKEIRAKIICGAANNQLETPEVADWFYEHNVFYVPDYVANAGGLINVVCELEHGGYAKTKVLKRIQKIKKTLERLFALSRKRNLPPSRVADELAEGIFLKGYKNHSFFTHGT